MLTPTFPWWATFQAVDDRSAHQVREQEVDDDGLTVYLSLCGRLSGAVGWMPAGPNVMRCRHCQRLAEVTPDRA